MSIPENTKGTGRLAGAAVGIIDADRRDGAMSRTVDGAANPRGPVEITAPGEEQRLLRARLIRRGESESRGDAGA